MTNAGVPVDRFPWWMCVLFDRAVSSHFFGGHAQTHHRMGWGSPYDPTTRRPDPPPVYVLSRNNGPLPPSQTAQIYPMIDSFHRTPPNPTPPPNQQEHIYPAPKHFSPSPLPPPNPQEFTMAPRDPGPHALWVLRENQWNPARARKQKNPPHKGGSAAVETGVVGMYGFVLRDVIFLI